MLAALYNIVFIQLLHYIILNNSLHYLTHNTSYTNWSVVAWITSVPLFEQWHYEGISPFLWYISSLHTLVLLKINANASPISSLTSCKNLGCSSSIPGLLSVFSHFCCSTTSSLVNIVCANQFPLSKHVCLGSGMLPMSSSVNTELKYILSTSAASSSSTITSSHPSSLFNGPTLSFLFCLLLT